MLKRQMTLVWAVCLVALGAGCEGCTGREEPAAKEYDEDTGAVEGGASVEFPAFRVSVIGQEDESLRHLSTVAFDVVSAPKGALRLGCNGVLIASNLVLTAAHCACAPSQGETSRFDGSNCTAKVGVRVHYPYPSFDGGFVPWQVDKIAGDISIHPRFELVLDSQGAIVTSRADLAIIRLGRPPRLKIEPVRLATEEVQVGEVASVVGLGYANTGHIGQDSRWFSREKLQTPASEDRILFGSMEQADYKGDTGGPCLRETKRGLELVGISQRGLGRTPACTRIAPYREWLEEQIRAASGGH